LEQITIVCTTGLYYKIVVFVIEVKPDFRAKLKLVFCCSIFKGWNFIEPFEQSFLNEKVLELK